MCNTADSQSVSWTLEQMAVLNWVLVTVDGGDLSTGGAGAYL